MSQFVFSLLLGVGQGSGQGGGMQSFVQFAPIVAIIAIFYFLIIRPQNKKQKETQQMLKNLKKGDRITTIGGIHGVIQSVREGAVIVKVDENCKIEFSRSAIATVEAVGKADKAETEENPEEDSK